MMIFIENWGNIALDIAKDKSNLSEDTINELNKILRGDHNEKKL